jgi:hypothetical protein
MPKPGTVQQEEKENKKQHMPAEPEPVFHQEVHDNRFLKSF